MLLIRSLRLQLREQNHVADAFLAQQHHAQTVNTHAHAAAGRHAVFERDEEGADQCTRAFRKSNLYVSYISSLAHARDEFGNRFARI